MNSYSTSWWSLLLINRPREDERLSWPCWQTYSGPLTHKVIIRPASSQVQDRESSPVKDQRSTTVLRRQFGHFRDESFHAIDCTGIDNQTTTKTKLLTLWWVFLSLGKVLVLENQFTSPCHGTSSPFLNHKSLTTLLTVNKLALVKKKQKCTQKGTKPKPTGHSSPVRTTHMSVHITGYNVLYKYSIEQFW